MRILFTPGKPDPYVRVTRAVLSAQKASAASREGAKAELVDDFCHPEQVPLLGCVAASHRTFSAVRHLHEAPEGRGS
jgi:hypothetical protein